MLNVIHQSHSIQGSVIDLEEGVPWGGPHMLVMLEEVPGLACSADRGLCAAYDNRAALMEVVGLTTGQKDVNIMKLAGGEVRCHILNSDEAGSSCFS